MNKIWKILFTLLTIAAFSNPAAAQLSGEVSFSATNFSSFSAKIALEYGFQLSATSNASVGATYVNNPLGAVGSSSFALTGTANFLLSNDLAAGADLVFSISSLGVANTVSLSLTPYITYLVINTEQLALAVTGKLPISILTGFGFGLVGFVDGFYIAADNLGIAFGISAGFSIVPFAFSGVGFYVRADYTLSETIMLFAGFNGLITSNFGYNIYGGIHYDITDSFALKLTAGYSGAFRLTLSGLFNR